MILPVFDKASVIPVAMGTTTHSNSFILIPAIFKACLTSLFVIICSNEEAEIHFCTQRIHINDYK